MKELIHIESRPALLTVNFQELREHLASELERYDVLVTAETLADAKKLATELNATKKVISDARKAEVAKASKPVRDFEDQMKELVTMVEEGRQRILTQVTQFEDETREKARELLVAERTSMWVKHGIDTEFQRAEFDDLVLLTSVTKGGKLAAGARNKLEGRVIADRQLQDRTRMRLMDLENRSYRAGLAAPLTRDHVGTFLFADEQKYESELERIIAAEVRRQEESEARMRKQFAQEQARQKDAENQDQISYSEGEGATTSAPTEQPAAPAQPTQSERDPEPGAVPTEQPGQPYRPTSTETDREEVEVICAFRTNVHHSVPDEEIEKEIRRVLARAGIESLEKVTVCRKRAAA